MNYSVLAYYVIDAVDEPEAEVKEHRAFLKTLDSKGRIYVSKEGVNAQLSLHDRDVDAYLQWMQQRPLLVGADVKIHKWPEHAFDRLTVKFREQLVAVCEQVDFSKRGKHISPKEWRERLESKDPNTIVIDVRNNYESAVGTFEGAICPDLSTFREFPGYAKKLKSEYNPEKTKVMMFCTGGIRCEYYSAILRGNGFDDVAQLNGGVIRYGMEEGNKHWKGKLFVFDDRLVVPISEDEHKTVSHCKFCEKPSDVYYNCAHMDCNDLFISCPECALSHKGCCSDSCMQAGRVRAFEESDHPKPFRRLSQEEKAAF